MTKGSAELNCCCEKELANVLECLLVQESFALVPGCGTGCLRCFRISIRGAVQSSFQLCVQNLAHGDTAFASQGCVVPRHMLTCCRCLHYGKAGPVYPKMTFSAPNSSISSCVIPHRFWDHLSLFSVCKMGIGIHCLPGKLGE